MQAIDFGIAVVIFFASLVQTLAGFGFGLIAVPFLLSLGLGLPSIIILTTFSSLLNTARASWLYREDLPLDLTLKCSLMRLLFLPAGIYTLYRLTYWSPEDAKVVAGWSLVFLLLIDQLSRWRVKSDVLSPIWFWLASALSGYMAGYIGIGGPPLVLWGRFASLPAKRLRAFTLSTFSLTLLPTIVVLLWTFPSETSDLLWRLLYLIPVLLLGTALGKMSSHKVSPQILKRIIYLVLIFGSFKLALGF